MTVPFFEIRLTSLPVSVAACFSASHVDRPVALANTLDINEFSQYDDDDDVLSTAPPSAADDGDLVHQSPADQ